MKLFVALLCLFVLAAATAADQTRGACCTTRSGRHCVDSQTTESCRVALDGVYLGDNTMCSSDHCEGMTGACCGKDGKCTDSVAIGECGAEVGTFAGFGKLCEDKVCSADEPAEQPTRVMGHVRDKETGKVIVGATVVILNRERVRVAEDRTNDKGAFHITVPEVEVSAKHAPFQVVVSEKNLQNSRGDRCTRLGEAKPLSLHEIDSAHHKYFERNIDVRCKRFGGGSNTKSGRVIHKAVVGSLLKVRHSGGAVLDASQSDSVSDSASDSDSYSYSDSDSYSSEASDSASSSGAIAGRHEPVYDDDDTGYHGGGHHGGGGGGGHGGGGHGGGGHGGYHGGHGHHGHSWWWFWAIFIVLLILCCIGVCVWSLFYYDPYYYGPQPPASKPSKNEFTGAMRAKAAVKY